MGKERKGEELFEGRSGGGWCKASTPPWGCGKHPGEGRGRGAGPQGDPSPVGHRERQRVQPPTALPQEKKTQPGPGEFPGAAALYLASSWVPGLDGAFPYSLHFPPGLSPHPRPRSCHLGAPKRGRNRSRNGSARSSAGQVSFLSSFSCFFVVFSPPPDPFWLLPAESTSARLSAALFHELGVSPTAPSLTTAPPALSLLGGGLVFSPPAHFSGVPRAPCGLRAPPACCGCG